VKALRQGTWSSAVLNYINSINAHGANSVWEHTLLDGASKQQKRKPAPKDTIQAKSNFIRSKHVNLDFVLKPNFQNDDTAGLEVELSKQLHASVRSANLETSLRLLAQGANCNYVHAEKGLTTPLHSAAKSGQSAQVELLLLYGGDVNAVDSNGNTAVDLAKQNGFTQVADRLVEASYEVTDRIIYFLCGRKPDHSSGQHLIIPEQSKVEINEHLKIARGKLQLIPNKMFEELVMDLFEEVDRREMETSKKHNF
jgi:G protein-coupled receptor kinase interacting protein 2